MKNRVVFDAHFGRWVVPFGSGLTVLASTCPRPGTLPTVSQAGQGRAGSARVTKQFSHRAS